MRRRPAERAGGRHVRVRGDRVETADRLRASEASPRRGPAPGSCRRAPATVLTSATGQRINSSMRRTYLIARAGRSAQLRAPARRVPASPRFPHRPGRPAPGPRRAAGGSRRLRRRSVAGADVHRLEAVEHVEFGQRDAGDAADRDRLAHQHRVEPAAAAPAAGDGAELMAALAEPLADLVVELGREGARARPASCRP